MDPWRNQIAQWGMKRAGGGFNPYAAGDKQYGITGRSNATSGPLDSPNQQQGYNKRDMEARAKKQAVLQRMQAAQNGNYMSADYLRGVK